MIDFDPGNVSILRIFPSALYSAFRDFIFTDEELELVKSWLQLFEISISITKGIFDDLFKAKPLRGIKISANKPPINVRLELSTIPLDKN
jgi:hypothetical protein